MNIGTTIKELRKKKSMKQGDFAELIGISPTALSQIENNVSRPKKSTLERICSELGIQENVLFLLSLSEDEVPESKKDMYNAMYPQLKAMMLNIFYEEDNKVVI